jgi:hypothetical protein
MLKKILIGAAGVVVLLLVVIQTRPNEFKMTRSGVIEAPADKIYPFLTQFKLGEQWSPFDTPEMKLKKTFAGEDGTVGAKMTFEGDKEGAGELTILRLVPNQAADIRLHMTKPFDAENLIEYSLQPEGTGTKFTWTMSGKMNFLAKAFSLFMDCEKMLGPEFEKGIASLKRVVEAQK